ncbi:hypothetical protein [Gemmatimonas sp.]|uniref:hypothetical protein n=1 Tax=Gemmatimonas sp. TaxID=1962908 RepID=UPI0025BA1DC5|nr:hypothetical protein [Gemmatimonas sp.]MCA2983946.1 hypothetical protein [Gemmatimonas sp.]
MTWRRLCRSVGVALACGPATAMRPAGLAAQAKPPAAADTAFLTARSGGRVQAGSLVQPDTVEVGDPITFVVTVAVPEGARVEWPSIADSAATVAMREPVRITDQGMVNGQRRERAVYTLSAWDVGALPIDMPDVVVRIDTAVVRVPLTNARVFVRSVLPGDSTQHIPKPARELFPRVVPWWQQWWPALLVLAALGALWWYRRRRRRAPAVSVARDTLDPFTRARHEFERLERLGLADAGEAGRYVALALDVLRLYLAERLPSAALSLTSGELVAAIGDDERVPRDRLRSLLTDVDGIKFAARLVSPARARELAGTARVIVDEIEAVEQARQAAAEAARRAALEAAARERRDSEDAARRASTGPRGPKAGAGV